MRRAVPAQLVQEVAQMVCAAHRHQSPRRRQVHLRETSSAVWLINLMTVTQARQGQAGAQRCSNPAHADNRPSGACQQSDQPQRPVHLRALTSTELHKTTASWPENFWQLKCKILPV